MSACEEYSLRTLIAYSCIPKGISTPVHQKNSIPLVGVGKTCGHPLYTLNIYYGKLYQVIVGAYKWMPSSSDMTNLC
jgi:hypothetical protein